MPWCVELAPHRLEQRGGTGVFLGLATRRFRRYMRSAPWRTNVVLWR
jgi:hypothetical protein